MNDQKVQSLLKDLSGFQLQVTSMKLWLKENIGDPFSQYVTNLVESFEDLQKVLEAEKERLEIEREDKELQEKKAKEQKEIEQKEKKLQDRKDKFYRDFPGK